jgi:hypothetical protein
MIDRGWNALSPDELAAFSRWFEEFAADDWDRQIEEDIRSDRLDKAVRRTDDHFERGRCTPL